ncbi:MAG: hypothetical protein R3B98_07105 [Hyphomonas sp.]
MTEDFFAAAFEQARLALTDVIGKANLHLKPVTLTRRLARRTRVRLRLLESILRRLIVLLALSLSTAKSSSSTLESSASHRPVIVPEGVEDVTGSFPRLPRYRLHLLGRMTWYRLDGAGFPEGLPRKTGPVPALPLMVHASALLDLLRHPDRYAARLARRLGREIGKGMARPACLPLAGLHRLRPELGIVATGLPAMIAAAWPGKADTS